MRKVNQEPEDNEVNFGKSNSIVKQTLSTDMILNDLWDICDDGWRFSFSSSDNWSLQAVCSHGVYMQDSKTHEDFTSALVKLYHKVFDGHNDEKKE